MHRSIKIVFLFVLTVIVLVGTPSLDIDIIKAEAIPGEDGATGGGVKLTWSPLDYCPTGAGCGCYESGSEEIYYAVYLDGVLVADSLVETSYNLYQYGHTVEVVGICQGEESYPATILLESIEEITLEVWELNGYGPSGIGFDVTGEEVSNYMMSDSTNRDKIDCYFTDFNQGYLGPYSLVSADQVISDPGGGGFAATGWRKTLISEALDVSDIDDVDIVPAQGYGNAADSVNAGNTYAILTQDGCYGLIQVIEIDETTGEIEIKATFQPIQGLRWM